MIKLPIGISDFKNIRENKLYYADKTLMGIAFNGKEVCCETEILR